MKLNLVEELFVTIVARVTLNLSGKMDDPEVEVGSLIAVEELDNMEDLDVGEKPEETLEDNLEENEVDQEDSHHQNPNHDHLMIRRT